MRRREVLTGFWLAVALPPVQAQPSGQMYRIAVIHPSHPTTVLNETGGLRYFKGLFGELRRLGYVEGQNMTVGRYSGQGRPERYGELARDLVRSAPNLIVANAARLIEHVAAATATIPIVAITNDPVAYGFAITLARPVTNITGVSVDAGLEVLGKRLEFLKEVVPAASRFAYLAPRAAWERPDAHAVREAARQAGILLIGGLLGSPIQEAEYRRVFIAMANEGVDALVVGDHAEHISNLRVIVELAESARLPAIYSYREFAGRRRTNGLRDRP